MIKYTFQCQNLVRFCELIFKKCPNLKSLNLLTTQDEQFQHLEQLKDNLKKRHVEFNYSFSQHLHDRQIK